MSEQTKYVNAYIDHAVGMLHENLTSILQTKAQLRVANELVVEKDKTISALQSELEQHKSNLTDKNTAVQNAQKWEADYNAMKNKVSHMDTLLHQMNDMKKRIIEKTDEFDKMVALKDVNYNSMVAAKDDIYNKMISAKDTEIEALKKKIIDLQSTKKSINRKKPLEIKSTQETVEVKPIEINSTIVEETPTVLPVVLSVVNEQTQQPRETDDF